MNTFGNIKTNIENTAVELAKKPEFKRFIFEFNSLILKNKDLSELYFIYDDLSSNKSLSEDIVIDYINESIEYSQILVESQIKNINHLNTWINSWNKSNKNNYSDIDNIIYSKGIKNLESILESKKRIKNTLVLESKKLPVKENFNLPISSIVKIANENLKKELPELNESEKKELQEILSLNGEKLKSEFEKTKNIVLNNLKNSLNESKDNELNNTISKTIEKIKSSKCNHYDFYKLKKLSTGL
jgi:hypothetical protein